MFRAKSHKPKLDATEEDSKQLELGGKAEGVQHAGESVQDATKGSAHAAIKLLRLQMQQKPFEPLFGNAALYTIINGEFCRASESFHFDATPESIRRQYGTCYFDSEGNKVQPLSLRQVDFTGTCTNIANISGEEHGQQHACQITVTKVLLQHELFLVIQLSKFLFGDAEKASAPYYANGLARNAEKHFAACNRLGKYLQPLGLGLLRLCDETGRLAVSPTSGGELRVQMLCQRWCFSDKRIQIVRKNLPVCYSAVFCVECLFTLECAVI
jgi:hypothetical protein